MKTFDLPEADSLPDSIQFSPDGRSLAAQRHDGRVQVLDTESGELTAAFSGKSWRVGVPGVGFNAEGSAVVFFGGDRFGSVHRYDLRTGRVSELKGGREVAWSPRGDLDVCASPSDGRSVFVSLDVDKGTVEIQALDPDTGEVKFAFARQRTYLRELAASPDGDWVAGCSAKDVRVWHVGAGKRPKRAKWHVQDLRTPCFGNLALSHGGEYIATGGYLARSGRVRVWALKTGEEQEFREVAPLGGGVAFAGGRPLLAFTQVQYSNDRPGEVIFWDAAGQREVARYDWGVGPIEAVAFSRDGMRCATAGKSKAVIWDVDV